MKKVFVLLFIIFCALSSFANEPFTKKASKNPILIQKGKEKAWCPICGMNLKMFYKTSHAVKLKTGENKQYCSLRCFVLDFDKLKNNIKEILVIDAKTEEMINAKQAYYVLGSKIPGTMSRISKFAFLNKSDAEEFKNKYGGKIVTFDEVFISAKNTLYQDIGMSFKKKTVKMYPMGKKIYIKKCDKINPENYKKINILKADIKSKKLCSDLKEKQLQAVALYLWEKKRIEQFEKEGKFSILQVNHKEKCPVCGMFVYKYPRWIARIKTNKKQYYFDGVKDMMKFYFEPSKWGNFKNIKIEDIIVTDYYYQKPINARKAFYVVGSNIFGPMGNEFIPFENKDDAIVFMNDHQGKKIYKFDEINKEITYKLDETN